MKPRGELHGRTQPLFITRITVDDLFGRYTYDLKCNEGGQDCSQLLLLYGENGTGKTTILSLIYHLVSRAIGKGHRTSLAKIRFKRFAVTLSDDSELSATRSRGNVVGTYRLSLKHGTKTHTFQYKVDKEGEISLSEEQRKLHSDFRSLLPDLDVFLLPDDRKISAEIELQGRDSEMRRLEVRNLRRLYSSRGEPGTAILSSTEPVLEKLVQWIREQALAGSNVGQLNVNSIYSDIVGRLVGPSTGKHTSLSADELARVLAEQAVRNHKYSRFGFTSELEVGGLVQSVLASKGTSTKISVIAQILRPFIDGNEARLRALEPIQQTVDTLVDGINSFYSDKKLIFHLQEGIRIVSEDGTVLDPQLLSSGEKQLLILFCNVIMTRRRATIFIIDEPELSLNIKWQRQLIDALLACVKNASVQFVFATHSLEILARHRGNVVRLENQLRTKGAIQAPLFTNA